MVSLKLVSYTLKRCAPADVCVYACGWAIHDLCSTDDDDTAVRCIIVPMPCARPYHPLQRPCRRRFSRQRRSTCRSKMTTTTRGRATPRDMRSKSCARESSTPTRRTPSRQGWRHWQPYYASSSPVSYHGLYPNPGQCRAAVLFRFVLYK